MVRRLTLFLVVQSDSFNWLIEFYMTMFCIHSIMINHRTYRRGPISKGNIACAKRFSERVGAEIKGNFTEIPMGRLTNLNPKVESEISFPNILINLKDVRGKRYYVVCLLLSQSKQPISSANKNGESPKGIFHSRKHAEFATSRKTKVWGIRRIHSTAFICRKGSSKFSIGEVEFKGSAIKDQFDILYKDLKCNKKANNLTTILSNTEFLIECYSNIKSKPDNMTSSPDNETFGEINKK